MFYGSQLQILPQLIPLPSIYFILRLFIDVISTTDDTQRGMKREYVPE